MLAQQFVCAWVNIRHDPAAGASYPHPPTDGAMEIPRGLGEHNMQILMLTPDGGIVNALAGYIGPRDLVDELKFALALVRQLKGEPSGSAKDIVSRAHAERAAGLESQKSEGFVGAFEDLAANFIAIGPKRAIEDHRFMARNPLLPARSFSTAMLVGDAKSSFVWHTSGDLPPLDFFAGRTGVRQASQPPKAFKKEKGERTNPAPRPSTGKAARVGARQDRLP